MHYLAIMEDATQFDGASVDEVKVHFENGTMRKSGEIMQPCFVYV